MKKLFISLFILGLFSCQTPNNSNNLKDIIGKEYTKMSDLTGFKDYSFSLENGKIAIYRNENTGIIIIESSISETRKIAQNLLILENINSNTKFDFGVCLKGKPDDAIMIIQSQEGLASSVITKVIFADTIRNLFTQKSFEDAKDCFEFL